MFNAGVVVARAHGMLCFCQPPPLDDRMTWPLRTLNLRTYSNLAPESHMKKPTARLLWTIMVLTVPMELLYLGAWELCRQAKTFTSHIPPKVTLWDPRNAQRIKADDPRYLRPP